MILLNSKYNWFVKDVHLGTDNKGPAFQKIPPNKYLKRE